MVHKPTRGDVASRTGPDVTQLPDTGGSVLDADVYRDAERFERERQTVLRSAWLVVARSSELVAADDWVRYEGHGEAVVISRQNDGSVAAFHDVCQHRGARITRGEESGCDRRFTCPWHGWVYDSTGRLVGVPDREDFDSSHLEGLRSPDVAADEWAGWVWINLAGPQAPKLLDWIGPEIVADLGRFAMDDMVLHEKLVFDVPVNYKVIVDAFNEVYHVTELHHVQPDFTKAARDTTFHLSGPNSMMFVPNPARLDELAATGDHQANAICHYVVFPNTVFNNNPDQIQLFQPVPLTVDTTRFICWELLYADDGSGDHADYRAGALAHWDMLQRVVGEDVFVFSQVAPNRQSMGYRQNVFSERECKLTHYHQVMDHCVDGGSAMDYWGT
ncbi:MAG: aromatic ring-hydroxylating oxygenase subunit alpha [Acidimicrobiales bacterium]